MDEHKEFKKLIRGDLAALDEKGGKLERAEIESRKELKQELMMFYCLERIIAKKRKKRKKKPRSHG